MIKTFRCKHTEKVFLREPISRFSQDVCRKALRKLLLIDAAERLNDLREPPGNHLEWRICFRWEDGDAFEIEIVDYH
jgi:proteic killer suppression protein